MIHRPRGECLRMYEVGENNITMNKKGYTSQRECEHRLDTCGVEK